MAGRRLRRQFGWVATLGAMLSLTVAVLPAHAQPPASNPNEMCGTGETFTVELDGTSLGIDDTNAAFRRVEVPAVADDDQVTLPKGCRIYAFLISGFGDNKDYDRIIFYKFAEFVAQNNGYVHVGWWNNLTKEYMQRPLHPETITIQKVIPILGIPIGDPVVIHPTPQTTGVPDTFLNTALDLPKANPDEDTQFQSDARMVLKAVREHNPNALIIVVGHSMGGNAVARLATASDVSIDLLAPIDPVGNRDMPRGELGQKNFNWTRWRAAVQFRGYKQWDCVRNALNLCADTDPSLFGIAFTCKLDFHWLPVKPSSGTRAPLVCNRPLHVDPGTRLRIGTNVRHLYHRWQQESFWPVDFPDTELFLRSGVPSATNILSTNYQAPILPQLNPLLPNDPNKTCFAGTDPRDDSFQCNPTDGHGEIIGVRVEGLTTRVRPGLQLNNWPPRSNITFTPGDRRDRLIQLAVDGAAWPYRPQNPDLCLVCDDIIAITQHLMAQQPEETTEDVVPPASQATQEPDANAAGWVNEDVVVSIGATDAGSGVQEVNVSLSGAQVENTTTPGSSAHATINTEGLTTVSFFASDQAGNTEAPHTLEVRIDKTPPEVVALTDIPINSEGWIGASVVVSFPASDNAGGSGLAASSPDVAVSTEGTGQEVIGTAEDNAGNSSSASVTLNLDLTPPAIALDSRVPAANAHGWNNSPVTVTWNCTDALSGAEAPLHSAAVGSEGAAQSAIGTCRDLADHVTTDTLAGINIDMTPPEIAAVTSPAPNGAGWNNSEVLVSFAASDALSGLASSPPERLVSTEGAGQQIDGTAHDKADNSASASVVLSIDKTSPGIALANWTPAANGAGWNNTDVTLTRNCSDALSGPVVNQVSQSVGAEGAAQSVIGTCADRAGHTVSDVQSLNIDKTSPISQITTPADGAVYLLNSVVNAAYGCADARSGVSACAGPVASGAALDTATVGTKTFTVHSADAAGNQGAASHAYVVQYSFSGFSNPIAAMPTINTANAGRTVPVKYSLRDVNGVVISDLTSFVSLASAPVACDAGGPTAAAEESDAAGSTEVRFESDKFIYNWKTSTAWKATCRVLQLTLKDGTRHMVAFQFK